MERTAGEVTPPPPPWPSSPAITSAYTSWSSWSTSIAPSSTAREMRAENGVPIKAGPLRPNMRSATALAI